MKDIIDFGDLFSTFEEIFLKDDWFSKVPQNFSSECDFFTSTGVPIDIYLKENRDYVIEAAIAGYNKSNINLKFEGNHLTISGKKEERENGDKRKYLHRGLKKSNFSTRLLIPKAKYNQNKTSATMVEGVLTIVVPAKAVDKQEKETINVNIS